MVKVAQIRREATLIGHQLFADVFESGTGGRKISRNSSKGFHRKSDNGDESRLLDCGAKPFGGAHNWAAQCGAFQLCSFLRKGREVLVPRFVSKKLQSRLAALLDLRQERRPFLIVGLLE